MTPEALDALVASGATVEMIAAAWKAEMATRPTPSTSATRMARKRARDNVTDVTSQSVTSDESDASPPPSPSFPPDPLTNPTRPPVSDTRTRKAGSARLPSDWKPTRFADDTVARKVVDRRGKEWARAALESFRAWAANAEDKDGKGRKRDWQLAWVKWVIEQDKNDGQRNGTRTDSAAGHDGLGPTARSALRVIGGGRSAGEPAQSAAGYS